MSKWEPTGFASLEVAWETSKRWRQRPKDIETDEEKNLRFFLIPSEDLMVAQKVDGGPVLSRTFKRAPFRQRDRWHTGPWITSKTHKTLKSVKEHYEGVRTEVYFRPVLQVVYKKEDRVDEFYVDDAGNVKTRVITAEQRRW